MSKIRVLHFTRITHGGVSVVINRIANSLDKSKFKPFILIVKENQFTLANELKKEDYEIDQDRDVRKYEKKKDHKSRYNKDNKKDLNSYFWKNILRIYLNYKSIEKFFICDVKSIAKIYRLIKKYKVQIIHTHHDIQTSRPEAMAAWLASVPCVIHIHGYGKLTYFDKLFTIFVKKIIYISESVRKHYHKLGYPICKGMVIHNSIEPTEYLKQFDRESIRNEFSIKNDEILVGIIGRIEHWKGHEYFIEGIYQALKKIPNLKGLIVGELEKNYTPEKNKLYLRKLLSLVSNKGLEKKIIFGGYRSDIPRVLAGLDVAVHASSKPEPFGLVIIEAMAAGKPVIATKDGGVKEIIHNNEHGHLVHCKDAGAIAEKIIKIVKNKKDSKILGLKAKIRVLKNFTTEIQAQKVEKLYDSIR